MNRSIRPTVVMSLFVAAVVALSGCTTSESEATASASSSPVATSAQEVSSSPSSSQGGVIRQVLDGYELPGEEVVFIGAHLADGKLTYNFQLGEDAYQKYALRVGQNTTESDTYVTSFEELPWLETDQVKATVQGIPSNVVVVCKITATPWVPAAGGHVPPVSRT